MIRVSYEQVTVSVAVVQVHQLERLQQVCQAQQWVTLHSTCTTLMQQQYDGLRPTYLRVCWTLYNKLPDNTHLTRRSRYTHTQTRHTLEDVQVHSHLHITDLSRRSRYTHTNNTHLSRRSRYTQTGTTTHLTRHSRYTQTRTTTHLRRCSMYTQTQTTTHLRRHPGTLTCGHYRP